MPVLAVESMPAHDARGRCVVLQLDDTGTLAVARAARRRRLSPLGAEVTSTFRSVSGPVLLPGGVAFWGEPAGPEDPGGVFVARGRRITPVVVQGMPLPGARGGRASSIGSPVAVGRGVVLEVGIEGTEAVDPLRFFSWSPARGLRRFDRPESPEVRIALERLIAAGPASVAGIGRRQDGVARLVVVRRGGTLALASAGDTSPLGAPLTLDAPALARTRRGVAFTEGPAVFEARIPGRR